MKRTLSQLNADGLLDIVTSDIQPADLDSTFLQLAMLAYGDAVVEVSRYSPGSNFIALRHAERTGQFWIMTGFYIT